ncbi:phage head morphogenesis protein [Oligella urethralis]|uniref:phage head morphogenesis protein n=1 Tax=Oligella urethralis TaxID=90245 RepID=UPI00288B2299|nr:phage minor head protein [Oligella urethralis]
MAKTPDLGYALTLAPEAAIEYFESLDYRVSRNALDAYNAARHHAFTVAGVAELDLVGDIKKGLEKAIRDGTTFKTFQDSIDEYISKRGWMKTELGAVADADGVVVANDLAPYRLSTIFRTNVQSAYMAGKYKQLQEDVEIAPYWQYIAVMDDRTRPSHAASHLLVFRHDDPFWDSHYPPCDYNCRCTVRSLRERDLERFNLKPMSSEGLLTEESQVIGKGTKKVTVFTHPTKDMRFAPRAGFGHRPRFKKQNNIAQVLGDKLEKAEPRVTAKVFGRNVELQTSLANEFQTWVDDVLNSRRSDNSYRVIGVLFPEVLLRLNDQKIYPETASIILRDTELLHLVRESKRSRHAALSIEALKKLPGFFGQPLAIYLDTEDEALIYVISEDKKTSEKVVVRMNYTQRVKEKGKRMSMLSNSVRTAGRVSVSDLKNKRYQLIWPIK